MALQSSQIANLNALNQKIAGGYKASSQDLANLDYAKKQGYNYTPMAQGAVKVANPNELASLNESQIYRSGADIYKLPSVMSSDKITGGTTPTIQPVAPSFTDTTPYVAGLDTTTKGLESLVTTALAPTPQEKNISPITSKITELTGQFEQKPVDYQTELDKYGFKTNVQDLKNLNTQIASVKAEYDKISNQVKDSSGLTRIVGGTQDRLARQSAVELGGLSSMAQSLQGNVQMAQNIADKTIAIKYEPVEQEIANQKFQLEQVYSQLSRDEKKKADALKITLDERQRLIDDEKETEANINKIMTAAAQNGADTTTLQKIMGAKDVNQAVINAGQYLAEAQSGQPTKIGDNLYYDPITKSTKTAAQLMKSELGEKGLVSPSGNAYDMSTYAKDPKQAQSVQNKINEIGKFNSVQDIDAYIKSKYPNSPITGDMIAKASAQYGIGWEELVALIQHESYLGTSNVAKSNNNLGGITWNANFPASMKGTARPSSEGGNYVKFATLQDGVNSTAYELSKRKVDLIDEKQVTPVNTIAVNWAENIRDGKAKLSDITSEVEKSNPGLKSEVNSILKSLPPSDRQVNEAKDFVKKLKDLKDNSGLKYAVGPNWATRGMVGIGGAFGAKDDFLGKAQTIISKKALGSLIEAKSQGATFGALSDAELALLKSSGTTLSAWANEKNEKVTGFDISESKFKEELNNMITEYEKLIAQADGGQGSVSMGEDEAYKLYQQTVNNK